MTHSRQPDSLPQRIYLDNAATSWPKPANVYEAVRFQMESVGASAGRGSYSDAVQAADQVAQTRALVARSLNAESPQQIIFSSNGTAALNLAILGLFPANRMTAVKPHVLTTAAEHNSVLRPLQALADSDMIDLEQLPCDRQGKIEAAQVARALKPQTQLVAIGHASNVTATEQPIESIGLALADHPALFLCDAAQTWGYLPIDVQRWHIDLLAAPGHKGALGPLGTGILAVSSKADPHLQASQWGGTGGNSAERTMPAQLPSRLEAGNLNVPAIAGLQAGLRWLEEQKDGLERLQQLATQLDEGLSRIPGLQVWGYGNRLPLRSLVIQNLPASDLGAILDAEFGIQTRTGLHCAAGIHRHLGTESTGTVRISAGHQTQPSEIALAIDALSAIASEIS